MQDDRGFRAKVTDFGLAVHMVAGQTALNKVRGTEPYLPMEVFLDREVSKASDVHALGLVLWEIYHGLHWPHIWHAEKERRGCGASIGMHRAVTATPGHELATVLSETPGRASVGTCAFAECWDWAETRAQRIRDGARSHPGASGPPNWHNSCITLLLRQNKHDPIRPTPIVVKT